MKKLNLLSILCVLFTLVACNSSSTVDNSTVSKLNLNRYLGAWYEIARIDHYFERDMTHCTAYYYIDNDDVIRVRNRGYKKGDWKESTGKIKTTAVPGLLRVTFFSPFYSDYRVLMVAPDYSYALVGSGDDDYLWILSRRPTITRETRNALLREAQFRGYDTSALTWVDQSGEMADQRWE